MAKALRKINEWSVNPDIRFVRICKANPTKSIIGTPAVDFSCLPAGRFAFFFGQATELPNGGEFMNTLKIKQKVNKKENRSVE